MTDREWAAYTLKRLKETPLVPEGSCICGEYQFADEKERSSTIEDFETLLKRIDRYGPLSEYS